MFNVAGAFCRTIMRKQAVGVTGLGLSVFVLTHMLGNLLILVGPQAYNEYSHALVSNPLIYLAEAGLIFIFVVHVGLALRLTLLNWKAQPQGYAVRARGAKAANPASKTMWAQGLTILVFVVLHLVTFKYGTHYEVNYGQGPIRDLHRLVLEVFHQPGYVAWYGFALVVLGLHLSHGVGSALQTLGFNHPKYELLKKTASHGYAVVVAAGFIVQPLYVFFLHKG